MPIIFIAIGLKNVVRMESKWASSLNSRIKKVYTVTKNITLR